MPTLLSTGNQHLRSLRLRMPWRLSTLSPEKRQESPPALSPVAAVHHDLMLLVPAAAVNKCWHPRLLSADGQSHRLF